jgi:hypothetical protein
MKTLLFALLCIVAAAVFTSCSVTQGSINPTSHYVYPNSNVTPLGSTTAQINKFGFILPPRFRARDLDKLYNQALSKHQGADIIIDNKVDSKNTFLFIFHFLNVSMSGTAAKMEIGKQDIGQANFVPDNPNMSQQQATQNGIQQNSEQSQSAAVQPLQIIPVPEEKVFEPKAPKNPFRLGVQADFVRRDYMKPGIGFNAELFIGQRISVAPSLNLFSTQTIDFGYGRGSYTSKQTAIYTDFHFYAIDKTINLYFLTALSYESTKRSGSDYFFTANMSELGVGGGIGVGGRFLSDRLYPFVEVKYLTLKSLSYESPYSASGSTVSVPQSTSNARLSWGLRFALAKKRE